MSLFGLYNCSWSRCELVHLTFIDVEGCCRCMDGIQINSKSVLLLTLGHHVKMYQYASASIV